MDPHMKKWIALLLCLTMTLSLCACGGDSTVTTAPDETTSPATTADPGPTPADIYAQATDALAQKSDLKLEIVWAQTTTLGVDVFRETIQQTLELRDINGENFAAKMEETNYNGSYPTETEEIFIDGNLYTSLNNMDFRAEMTAEDYIQRMIPSVLLDESLYTVEQPTKRELTFKDGTAMESWLENPYTIFISGEGTAELDAQGCLVRSTYTVNYKLGSAEVELNVTVRVSEPDGKAIEAPAKSEDYPLLDTPLGPALVHLATGYLQQAHSMDTSVVEIDKVTAAAFTDITTLSVQTFGDNSDLVMKCVQSFQGVDTSSGQLHYDQTQEETYIGGLLTTTVDGGKPTVESGYPASSISSYAHRLSQTGLPSPNGIADFDLTQLGDVLVLEYTWDDETCREVVEKCIDEVLADPEGYLASSTKFTPIEARGSLSLDAATMMPMGMTMTFSGSHAIQGRVYETSVSVQQTVRLGGGDTFEAITGETLAEKEPEEKPTPVFYHVTGDAGQEMWLLGTIHVGDVRTKYLPDEIYAAFDASDALALEFESGAFMEQAETDTNLMQQIAAAYLYTDGTTVKDHISPELYEDAVKLLKATGNYQTASDAYKPYFLSQTLDLFFLDYGYSLSSDYGVDSLLEERANEQKKEILSVESGLSQLQMLAGFSDALQELLLEQAVYYGHVTSNMASDELFEMWCRGDEAELAAYLNDDGEEEMTEEEKLLMEEYNKAVSTDRDIQMAEVAKGYLESGETVFYAVGLAHLLAEDGLVDALRAAGYTVELVKYAQ